MMDKLRHNAFGRLMRFEKNELIELCHETQKTRKPERVMVPEPPQTKKGPKSIGGI